MRKEWEKTRPPFELKESPTVSIFRQLSQQNPEKVISDKQHNYEISIIFIQIYKSKLMIRKSRVRKSDYG
jgi:hypothetical protein